jgi:hypothetical protein
MSLAQSLTFQPDGGENRSTTAWTREMTPRESRGSAPDPSDRPLSSVFCAGAPESRSRDALVEEGEASDFRLNRYTTIPELD